jgi:hypothetical protein
MTVMQREGGQPAHTRRNRIGQAVIASEAALGVVLVLAAAMVVRNFVTLLTTDAGFRPANLHVLRVQPTGERRGGDDVAELARYRGILEIVRQLPGVESAGAADSMPAEASAPMTGFEATLGGRFGLWQILASPFGVTAATVSPAGASIRSALEQPRTQALMFGTFAVIALLLAALGLYAVTSFDVALRRYELGIRSSLGATAAMLRRAVAVDALRPVLVGTATGLVASYWISRWVETLVYDVDARDPWTFTSVAIVLVLTAIAASWFPARRAARIDPADVLRTL